MLDLTDLENRGILVKRFCGLDIEDGVGCTGEAVGELTAELEDGMQIPMPVCQPHLDAIMSKYEVQDRSI